MQFINKVEIRGKVGRATISTINGKNVLNFSVCVDSAASSNETPVVDTIWFNVTFWQNSPDEIVVRGDTVHVWGRFRMRRYINPLNEERTTYDILADKIVVENDMEE